MSDFDAVSLEYLGHQCSIGDADDAMETLCRAAEHPSPTIREGAVYGLAALAKRIPSLSGEIRGYLRDMAREDFSMGVRDACWESLEDLG